MNVPSITVKACDLCLFCYNSVIVPHDPQTVQYLPPWCKSRPLLTSAIFLSCHAMQNDFIALCVLTVFMRKFIPCALYMHFFTVMIIHCMKL